MQTRFDGYIRRAIVTMAALAVVFTMTTAAIAQDELPDPRVEIFAGYSHLSPGGNVLGVPLPAAAKGFNTAVTWNFNRYTGFTADFSGHYEDAYRIGNVSFGPTVRYPMDRFVPFAHALFGFQRVSPEFIESETKFALLFGGGIDLRLTRLLSWRVIQADWVHSAHNFALLNDEKFNGTRLSSGIVFNLGALTPPVPPSATCSANPAEVMEGEPLTVTATPSGFNPKHVLNYAWTSTGGKVSGTGATAQIDTTGVAGGSYSANARITDPKKSKAMADCSANFTVKERPKNPPVISCSANPTTVQSGQPSTVTCTCTSPDNAQLQPLAWQTSGGTINGQGMSAALDTAGAAAGAITVTTTCTDARNLSSSATTNVNVEVPPPPATASKIGECAFPNKAKPARVDNTCKAILDDVALRLQRDADARAVVVGEMAAKEKNNHIAGQRATNTKAYLVNEKQIDAGRIDTVTGGDGDGNAEVWIVPSGATFDMAGTQPVMAPAKKRKR